MHAWYRDMLLERLLVVAALGVMMAACRLQRVLVSGGPQQGAAGGAAAVGEKLLGAAKRAPQVLEPSPMHTYLMSWNSCSPYLRVGICVTTHT
jgi:hypothetical protein